MKIEQLVLLLFLIQISIISLLQCISQLFLQFFAWPFNALLWTEVILVVLSSISSLISSILFSVFNYMRDLFSSKKLFTLVSNMQISRFNLITCHFCKWSASYTLISRYAIIFSRDLTCSSVVRLSSCRSRTVVHLELCMDSQLVHTMVQS